MCCIFTCCGWMIDLIQRLWTFTMSCCISSAVCCSLLTASMSGVALGYNYSLAEYIDLKETNVSVYLKRGVFDDDIADDVDWRRSGRMPISGHIREDNLLTGSDESTTMRSGRRLDDSIYESNDRNNFEGSLMRLTAKAPDPSPSESTPEVPIGKIIQQYSPGSLDQLKAVQSAINMRKSAAAANRRYNNPHEQPIANERIELKSPKGEIYGRRAMTFDAPPFDVPRSTLSSLRQAVPDDSIAESSKWLLPKLPPKMIPKDILYMDDYMNPTYPVPVTPKPGPIRPTRPKSGPRMRPSPTTKSVQAPTRSEEPNLPKSIDEVMESFKGKVMVNKPDSSGLGEEFLKKLKMGGMKADVDYEEDIKGVPMRKKRSNHLSTTNQESIKEKTDSNKIKTIVTSKDQIKENLLITTLLNPGMPSQSTIIKILLSSTIS